MLPVSNESSSRDIADRAKPATDHDIPCVGWLVRANPWPDPDLSGRDAFEASAVEVPGALFYAETSGKALALAEEWLLTEFRAGRIGDGLLGQAGADCGGPRALVQLNVRVSREIKERIVKRADELGVSLTRFVRDQCLEAPAYRDSLASPGNCMPVPQKREAMRKAARLTLKRNAGTTASDRE